MQKAQCAVGSRCLPNDLRLETRAPHSLPLLTLGPWDCFCLKHPWQYSSFKRFFSVNDIFQNVLIEELWPFTQYVSVLQGCVLKGNIKVDGRLIFICSKEFLEQIALFAPGGRDSDKGCHGEFQREWRFQSGWIVFVWNFYEKKINLSKNSIFDWFANFS